MVLQALYRLSHWQETYSVHPQSFCFLASERVHNRSNPGDSPEISNYAAITGVKEDCEISS